MKPRYLLISDLDGTLACEGRVSEKSRAWLEKLGGDGVVRVLATGRSRLGVEKVLGTSIPMDYVLFSSGAGIMDWPNRTLLHSHGMSAEAIAEILPVVEAHGWGFMLHDAIPGNHGFQFHATALSCPDFHRRVELLGPLGRAYRAGSTDAATQFVVIVTKAQAEKSLEFLRARLPGYSLIRATSPLDGHSTWIEIFPALVSKSQSAAWLCDHLGLSPRQAVAIGNDFNDLDLLEWAGHGYVVGQGLTHLRKPYPVVAPCHLEGFSEAVSAWHGRCILPPADEGRTP